MLSPTFLTFSDAAKFADIARNLVSGLGYGNSFTFWSPTVFLLLKQAVFPASWTPPFMPFSIAIFFKIFGINDFAVIATSFFYFGLTIIFTFLLTNKIFADKFTAVLSAVVVAFSPQLIMYATTGASESPFAFEILACAYFIALRKKWSNVMAALFMILLYFTRPLGFIYIAGLTLFYLLDRLKLTQAIRIFFLMILVGFLIDRFILTPLNGKDFIYSIISRGQGGLRQDLPGVATSDSLRGVITSKIFPLALVAKKVFYNLYNFYKLVPDILNPYLFALFIIGLFGWTKKKLFYSFKIAAIVMILLTLLVTAASIPFFRYLHPVIPLVYIMAVGTLVELFNLKFSKQTVKIACILLVLFFAVGPTLGILLLDSRFEKNSHNVGKPPLYVVLSKILKENTSPNQIIITNLDTWGSWYGERKTVWFPLKPKQIIDLSTEKIPFDAIYLTSYLIDDQNYYMGTDWRLIFNNPVESKKWTCDGCSEIANEFKLGGVYQVPSGEDYEKQYATAVLLVRK